MEGTENFRCRGERGVVKQKGLDLNSFRYGFFFYNLKSGTTGKYPGRFTLWGTGLRLELMERKVTCDINSEVRRVRLHFFAPFTILYLQENFDPGFLFLVLIGYFT